MVITPKFKDNNAAVVFCTDKGYVKYLVVALQSLIQASDPSDLLDVLIFTDDSLDLSQKLTLKSLSRENVSIRLVNVLPILSIELEKANFQSKDYWSVSMWFKCLIPFVLQKYTIVMYSDCDVLFRKNPLAFCQQFIQGTFKLIAVRDSAVPLLSKYPSRATHLLKDLQLADATKYFNSGLMFFNPTQIDLTSYKNALISTTNDTTLRFPDQDFLNIFFNDSVKLIPQTFNSQCNVLSYESDFMSWLSATEKKEFSRSIIDPLVVHFIGPCKPWNSENLLFQCDFWNVARKTPYYEDILKVKLSSKKSKFATMLKSTLIFKLFSQLSRIFFPYGSNRRYQLKKLLRL